MSLHVQLVAIEILSDPNPSKEKYLDNKYSIIQKSKFQREVYLH